LTRSKGKQGSRILHEHAGADHHLHDDVQSYDEEGAELPNFDAALRRAEHEARNLATVLFRVKFGDVISVTR
jgi:hypothetical protein